jgi:hypothetical protein
VILFFVAVLCVGIIAFRDYGISWDELVSRNNGLLTYKYVFEGDQELLTYRDRYYGIAFELPLIMIEKLIGFDDPREIFLMRHLAMFLLFWIGAIFFFLLCKTCFKSWKIGLIGSFFLVLSPRIFAHAFFNTKDLAFLSLFIISIFSLVKYLEEKTPLRATLHALMCAYLVSTRILGIIVPFFTLLFFMLDVFINKETKKTKAIGTFLLYILLLVFFTVMLWPVLWIDPLGQFVTAFKQMSHFDFWSTVLYMGEYVKAKSLPWHYIPVWILITTPVVYSIFFIIGIGALIKRARYPVQLYRTQKLDLVAVMWFFGPIVSVVALKSVLYDGWRHLFFIYPAFLIIALGGLKTLFEFLKENLRSLSYRLAYVICAALILSSLAGTSWFIIKYHPYQNVYFNFLLGDMKNAKDKFDLDYWGLSYRRALEYILENDKDKEIIVCVANPPGEVNALALYPAERNRLVFTMDPKQAKYFLSNYRWHKEEYPYKNEVFSIKVAGAKIMVVYKLQ